MIVVIGDCGVGKSALLKRLKNPEQDWTGEAHSTIGVDFVRKPLQVAGRDIMLQAWDTAGQDRFRSITTSYYRSAMGAVICFDSQNMTALKNIQTWIKDFREKARDGAPILLVATKQDLRQ